MKTKFLSGTTTELGERQVRVIASTGNVDRCGDVVEPGAIDLSAFQKNPVVLWQHDPEHPIGRASNISSAGGKLRADIEFAPVGTSKKADEICGLVKAGILTGVSIGFDPIKTAPLDGGSRGAIRYLAIDLMEISIVSIPANTDAAVVQRRHRPNVMREGRRLSSETRDTLGDVIKDHRAALASLRSAHTKLQALIQTSEGDENLSQDEKSARRRRQVEVLRLRAMADR